MSAYRMLVLGLGFVIFAAGNVAHAQALDNASTEALSKTQDLLNSPEQRNAYIQKDAKAKAADDKLKAIPGLSAADQQKAYEISAQIMATLVNKTGGDVTKQKDLIDQASRDPQSFLNGLPADQRKEIQDMAARTESKSRVVPH